MAQIIQEIKIEVAKPNLVQAIVAKQYDNGSRFLKVTLVNDGDKIEVLPTSTVTINAKRKDGQSSSFAGVVNDDGTVTVPLTYWMLELDGTVHCDISVIDTESRKLTTTTFSLAVERASCNSGDITEDENYDVLVKLIEDVNKVKPDLEYNPESENAQSGIAIAQALSGASGVKYIREGVSAQGLEDGMYIIDGENGGELQFVCEEASDYGFVCLQSGFVFVSYDIRLGGKKISCFSTDELMWCPILFTTTLDEDGNSIADTTDIYVSKKYVDEQIATLQSQIDELKNTPTIRTEFELNNKGDLVYSWDTGSSSGNCTKTNDGWSIVGYEKGSDGRFYFVLVGKTQQSCAMNSSSIETGSLNYNNETYYYSAGGVLTQYVVDCGKAVNLEKTYTNNTKLAKQLLDYYYGVA